MSSDGNEYLINKNILKELNCSEETINYIDKWGRCKHIISNHLSYGSSHIDSMVCDKVMKYLSIDLILKAKDSIMTLIVGTKQKKLVTSSIRFLVQSFC